MKLLAFLAAATLGLGSVAMADDTVAATSSAPPDSDATMVQNVQMTSAQTDDSSNNQDYRRGNDKYNRLQNH